MPHREHEKESVAKTLTKLKDKIAQELESTEVIGKETINGIKKEIADNLNAYLKTLTGEIDKNPKLVAKKLQHLERCYDNYVALNNALITFAKHVQSPQCYSPENKSKFKQHAEAVRVKANKLNNSILTLPQKVAMPFIDFIGAVIGAVGGIFVGMAKGVALHGSAAIVGFFLGGIAGAIAGPFYGAYYTHQKIKAKLAPAAFGKIVEFANEYVAEKEDQYADLRTKVLNVFRLN